MRPGTEPGLAPKKRLPSAIYCEAYLGQEVLPVTAGRLDDHSRFKLGYEIPFQRHFYEYEEPRPWKKNREGDQGA